MEVEIVDMEFRDVNFTKDLGLYGISEGFWDRHKNGLPKITPDRR